MILQLIRRDPGWRVLPHVTVGVAALVALWHVYAPVERTNGARFLLFEVCMIPQLLAFMAMIPQSQEAPFQTALPITVRQILLSRLVSTATMIALPLAVAVAILEAVGDPVISGLPYGLWALQMCVALGLQYLAVRIEKFNPLVLPVVMAVTTVSAGLTLDWPKWKVFALWIGIFILPFIPSARKAISRSRDNPGLGSSHRPWWRTGIRLIPKSMTWFLVPLFVLAMFPINVGLGSFLLPQWFGARFQYSFLQTLPIRRRFMLAAIAIPTLLGLCSAYEIQVNFLPSFRGVHAGRAQNLSLWNEIGRRNMECKTLNVLPARQYWLPAQADRAPLIVAPWGESFQPTVTRMSGDDLYNPFAVGCSNSPRFFQWQFERATSRAYGKPLTYQEDVILPRASGVRIQLLTLGGIVAFSLFSLLTGMIFDWYRIRRFSKRVRYGLMVPAVAAFMVAMYWCSDDEIISWLNGVLPANSAQALAVIGVPILMLAIALDAVFRQLEFAPLPVRK